MQGRHSEMAGRGARRGVLLNLAQLFRSISRLLSHMKPISNLVKRAGNPSRGAASLRVPLR